MLNRDSDALYSHSAKFCGMLILSVATFCDDQIPAIGFNEFDDFANLHNRILAYKTLPCLKLSGLEFQSVEPPNGLRQRSALWVVVVGGIWRLPVDRAASPKGVPCGSPQGIPCRAAPWKGGSPQGVSCGPPEVYPTIKGSRDAARQAWMETLKAKSS